jgi:hypothetical protein
MLGMADGVYAIKGFGYIAAFLPIMVFAYKAYFLIFVKFA